MHPIKKAFSPIYGRPSYLDHQGYGSFVTMEFGEPRLETDPPRDRPFHFWKKKKALTLPSRLVTVRGEWHLWIYCCDWVLRWQDRRLAHSESSTARIARGFALLEGQSLTDVVVNPDDGRSVFSFDLGCTLHTTPYGDDPEEEQWFLAEPTGWWWSVRADGHYSHTRGSASPDPGPHP